MWLRRERPWMLSVKLLVCASLCIGLAAWALRNDPFAPAVWLTEAEQRLSMANGDLVLALLERHRELHGRFPESLDELAILHGGPIPTPVGPYRDWMYQTDGKTFALTFCVADQDWGDDPSYGISSEWPTFWRFSD